MSKQKYIFLTGFYYFIVNYVVFCHNDIFDLNLEEKNFFSVLLLLLKFVVKRRTWALKPRPLKLKNANIKRKKKLQC